MEVGVGKINVMETPVARRIDVVGDIGAESLRDGCGPIRELQGDGEGEGATEKKKHPHHEEQDAAHVRLMKL